MRSKLLSCAFYLLITYTFVGIIQYLGDYFVYEHYPLQIAIFVLPFFLILFCLCYRSFYTSFRASVSMALSAYILSAVSYVLLLKLVPPESFEWDHSNQMILIYFLFCLALPIPYCYAIWYIDWYIGSRKKN